MERIRHGIFRALADALLGQQFGFKNLPPELSAIIYLERKVINGKIALSYDDRQSITTPLRDTLCGRDYFRRSRSLDRKLLKSIINQLTIGFGL